MRCRFLVFLALYLGITMMAACNQQPPQGTQTTDIPKGQESDWAAIEQLEREAKNLAITKGCEQNAQCRSAPVGSRACGGPRYYIPYCALTTDSVALYDKLDEVARAEQAYNKKYDIASTCEFRMPPTINAKEGVCTALEGTVQTPSADGQESPQ